MYGIPKDLYEKSNEFTSGTGAQAQTKGETEEAPTGWRTNMNCVRPGILANCWLLFVHSFVCIVCVCVCASVCAFFRIVCVTVCVLRVRLRPI